MRRRKQHGSEDCEHPGAGVVGPRGSRRRFRRALVAVAFLTLAIVGLGATTALASGAPAVETEKASEVTRTVAVLNASVDPNGLSTSCDFEYGTTEGVLDKTVPCHFSPGSRPIDVSEYAALSGLTEGTDYFFRIHATNLDGEVSGTEFEFSTLPNRPR